MGGPKFYDTGITSSILLYILNHVWYTLQHTISSRSSAGSISSSSSAGSIYSSSSSVAGADPGSKEGGSY